MLKANSLVDVLNWRGLNQPQRLAYRFLKDGELDEQIISYGELYRSARAIAVILQTRLARGERALLLFPPGLDFIKAFFGCMYAGVVAVPCYPPHPARLERTMPMIEGIATDAAPALVLSVSSLVNSIQSSPLIEACLPGVSWIAVNTLLDEKLASEWSTMLTPPEAVALLQYTSGSTGSPKGVMVSHSNLIHNLEYIKKNFSLSSESNAVFWLPSYHDMGLIGGVLEALYCGYPMTLLPHLAFLQQPFRWLRAISHFKAHTSGGPNFAYDLCVRKIRPEQRELLDLSRWKLAFSGAEKIHHDTIERFSRYFGPCGFSEKAWFPCYGMSEATLMISGGPGGGHISKTVASVELSRHHVVTLGKIEDATQTLVGCGSSLSEQEVIIVDPHTCLPCSTNVVGEVWVRGESVAAGYWNKAEETEATFKARLSDGGQRAFLRTGDLGFISDNQLYITGRLKDLIISAGNNYYPADIERTVLMSCPDISPLGCVAFSIDHQQDEALIVIIEINSRMAGRAEEIRRVIGQAINTHHDLRVHDIHFVGPGEIPKTSSGKLRRFLSKERYLHSINLTTA